MTDFASVPATAVLVAGTASRRQFLLAGSAAVAGALLLGGDLVGSPSGLQLLAASDGPRIPVAYLEGSAGALSLAAALAGSRWAIPAAGMRAAESLASHAARVSVMGFASDAFARHNASYTKVLLDAHLPSSAQLDQTIPFYAFTYRRDPAVSQSATSHLHVASGRALRFGFRLDAPVGAEAAATTVFTSRPQRGLPTLQPGVYLLGLLQGMWSGATSVPALGDPAWASLPSLVIVVEKVVEGVLGVASA